MMTEPTRLARLSDDLQRWHAAHPEASLSELEDALDTHLDIVRAELLAEVVATIPLASVCPDCGSALVRRGQHPRTLTTRGGAELTLERAYLTCPVCGDGLFPPG